MAIARVLTNEIAHGMCELFIPNLLTNIEHKHVT